MKRLLAALLLLAAVPAALVLPAAPAAAVLPDEMLADPALEARARTISEGSALRRLPEPVDRRQRCAAGDAICGWWCANS